MSKGTIAFLASDAPEAKAALKALAKRYGNAKPTGAQTIVALGGDGFMLRMLHKYGTRGIPIYGMNRGSVGFLMNHYQEEGLEERLRQADQTEIHPLSMTAIATSGQKHRAKAFNEISMLRQTYQAAKLALIIDGKERLSELICDGLLVSTPAGSTAYNLSAHGPILPIASRLLALTPLSPFRPRRWRGAVLPHEVKVEIVVNEAEKRPVSAAADHQEFRDVKSVKIEEDRSIGVHLMFDKDHSFAERVLAEQFRF